MYPSSTSTSSTRARSLEAGELTFGRRRCWALRMRVSKSPSGSFMPTPPSPARLDHSGDAALACQFAQHVAAHLELAVVAARAAGQLAAVAHPRGRRIARQLGELQLRRKAHLRRLRQIAGDLFQLLALRHVARNQLAAPVVLVDRTLLGHAFLQGRFGAGGCGRYPRNGKLKPRSKARASSSLAAVVHTITSMPQISAT